MRFFVTIVVLSLLLTMAPAAVVAAPAAVPNGPLPLPAYPRPANDNGLGIHWSSHIYGQTDEMVDYFVAELAAMGVHWVKFLNDGTEGRHNEYLVSRLLARGMMPVMRIYFRCNKGFDLASLRRLVQHYQPMGLVYYELFNEPELAGADGGWCDGEQPDPERLADLWTGAARVIEENGGYPGLPSMFPPSLNDPNASESFFNRFLLRIKEQGNVSVLYRSWGAVHNYFLNHPVNYPYDDVNLSSRPLTTAESAASGLSPGQVQSINEARVNARKPRAQGGYYVGDTVDLDPSCFLGFVAYRNRFYELFGLEIPLISTEGGATVGSSEDPRYPPVTERIMAERTLEAARYMLDQAPDYYFAVSTWLLAEQALGRPGSRWENWAWYHDVKGNHLPVVEQLKANPRRGESRGGRIKRQTATVTPVVTAALQQVGTRDAAGVFRNAPGVSVPRAPVGGTNRTGSRGLERFPRPPADNGWGMHWVPTLFGQSTDVVDRFVGELAAMGVKWVKIMQPDESKVEHEYLLQSLAKQGMMPILRVYRADNSPYQHLAVLVGKARPLGVYYYELYNEPNMAGEPGGWFNGDAIDVDRMVNIWLPAAREIVAAGGFPGVPAMTPGGDVEDTAFLRSFLKGVVAGGGHETLASSWIALHNYFLNHPLDYPQDPVNLRSVPLAEAEITGRKLTELEVKSINHAREISRQPRAQGGYYVGDTVEKDSNGFRKFEAYEGIAQEVTGLTMPILSTEGGAVPGTQEDPRYPKVTDDDVAARTVEAYSFMAERAPDYYFAFTPWILANLAAGNPDPQWEGATWFRGGSGEPMPVVAAVRDLAAQKQVRPNISPTPSPGTPSPTVRPTATSTPAKPAVQPTPTPPPLPSGEHGWLIFWRDGQPFNCTPVVLSEIEPAVRSWQAPVDGHVWGMEMRDGQGTRLTAIGQAGIQGSLPPGICGAPLPVPEPTPSPTATPSPEKKPGVEWDERLDAVGIKLIPAPVAHGAPYWKLISAKLEDPKESGGRHHIYIRAIDENGLLAEGAGVTVSWPDGQYGMVMERKRGNDPYDIYGANFPMYGAPGSYRAAMDGISDTVTDFGMPFKQHVNYLLVFQRMRAP